MNTSTSAHGATGGCVRNRGRSSLAVASCSRTAGRDDLVVAGFRRARDESVGPPTRHHVAAVGGAHRPGQPDPVDEQRLADLRRPGGAGVVGDHRQHHFAAAPAALPAGAERIGPQSRSARTPPAHARAAVRRSPRQPSAANAPDGRDQLCRDEAVSTSPCRARIAWPTPTMPPCRCTASAKPAFFTAASASAERTPVLQYSTGIRSCGSLARPVAGLERRLRDQLGARRCG